MSENEENIAKCIFNLKLNNGGSGVQSVVEISDSALIGSWTCFVDDVFNQLYESMNVNESDEDDQVLKLGIFVTKYINYPRFLNILQIILKTICILRMITKCVIINLILF